MKTVEDYEREAHGRETEIGVLRRSLIETQHRAEHNARQLINAELILSRTRALLARAYHHLEGEAPADLIEDMTAELTGANDRQGPEIKPS